MTVLGRRMLSRVGRRGMELPKRVPTFRVNERVARREQLQRQMRAQVANESIVQTFLRVYG
ncbi:MAG: hypothetical protein MHM6MM_008908, partial [Cercozoa sp. M6MM]